MKVKFGHVLPVLIIMTGIILSCAHKKDESVPAERKKYAWVAGQKDSTGYGMILYSADGGETWVRQGQGSAALKDIDVWDIWAVDENNVWAVCSGNVILNTTDGGQIWTRIQAPVNASLPRLSAISIVSKTNIWISGSSGTVYKSDDGGHTWTMFDTNFFHRGLMQGIWAVTALKVYVAGGIDIHGESRGFIGYTLDGGATWDSLNPAEDFNRNEWIGVASSGNTIVIYGGKSHYIVSADGGNTWKNDSVGSAGGGGGKPDINHLIMLDSKTWWGAFDMDNIYLTTDAGSNWTLQPSNQSGDFLFGIDAWDNQLAIVVGESESWPARGPVLKTSDRGATWITMQVYRSNLCKVSFIKQ